MRDAGDRASLSAFDAAAATYHAARPRYPDEIFDRLHELLPDTPHVIEVGPGTGQATEPMLLRGARVRAIELGPRLAVELAQRLGEYLETEQLEVHIADYEHLEPEGRIADAVVCATAYHWISLGEQLSRPPRWLVPGGLLAVIDTIQVASDDDGGYFDAAQPIYDEYGQATGKALEPHETANPPIHGRMIKDKTCTDVGLYRCRWDQTYDATSYRALLNTYSGTLAMPEPERTEMVDALVQLVDDRGGQVVRPLVITLATCRFIDR